MDEICSLVWTVFLDYDVGLSLWWGVHRSLMDDDFSNSSRVCLEEILFDSLYIFYSVII